MTRVLMLSAATLVLAACQAPEPEVEVADLTCRPTPNGRDMTACYVTLSATVDDRLVSISSSEADDVQVHAVRTDNGLMVMREMEDGLALPAGEAIQLRPGGDHIMVVGARSPLMEGGELPLVMTFEHAPPQALRARIGAPAPEGEGGGHH